MIPAVIDRRRLPKGQRILVISDIHGNLSYLRALLEKAQYLPEKDVIILCGDMLEKGPQSLQTLRYIMRLAAEGEVYPLLGNCDGWHTLLRSHGEALDFHTRDYILHGNRVDQGPPLLRQMCLEMGFPLTDDMDMEALRVKLALHFAPELDFLASLPHVIETEHYTFVHGGLPEGESENWDAYRCMKNDAFLKQGRRFDKWVIVGHWPVMLYREDITCANPIIDRESRIISIDGGNVLKDDGQLNALVIPYDGSEDFSHIAYDPFPVFHALEAQEGSKKSIYVRWGDNIVRVLQRGAEFSRVRHERTGYTLDVLSKYLYGTEDVVRCNDCTDYVLPVKKGDALGIVEKTSRGYLAKLDGVSGWYFGKLQEEEQE